MEIPLENQNGVTLSGLLNVLDGFYAPANVLFAMTTNRIEALDEALLQPAGESITSCIWESGDGAAETRTVSPVFSRRLKTGSAR